MNIKIWTDGGALNNPGPAAGGIVIEITNTDKRGSGTRINADHGAEKRGILRRKTYSEYFGETTNNIAEYMALIFALKKIRQLIGSDNLNKAKVSVFMDSELVVRQITNQYKIEEKDLIPLFIEAHNFLVGFPDIKFIHVLREENKEANELVQNELNKHRKGAKLFDL